MNKKSQELNIRNIMQGLEEFATFMSCQVNSFSMRILSVESVAQDQANEARKKAQVLSFNKRQKQPKNHQKIQRSLAFQNRNVH